jgi:hypothetical protein
MTVFWEAEPCRLVDVYRRFRGTTIVSLMMDVASSSETSLNLYQTTWRNIPENSRLRTRRRKNLKFHQHSIPDVSVM